MASTWKKYIPLLDWAPNYSRSDLNGDLSAGLTVGVMLIPQGMAYAMIAGLPPIYGLYAATLPLVFYAFFGTSRHLAVGPVAMISLLVAVGVGGIVEPGTDQYIQYVVLLSLMVGLIQLGLGVLRLGFLVNFLSHPVISGFTSAAALIIGLSQLKYLLGVDIPRSNYVHHILRDGWEQSGNIHWQTLLIGAGAMLMILIAKRIHKAIPGQLIAVILGILMVYGLNLESVGVSILGDIPAGLPQFTLSLEGNMEIGALIPIALTISLIAFMESMAVAKAIQAKHKNYQLDANQELVGLGFANLGGTLVGTFPTTGGFSRSAVNDQAGARTPLASLISVAIVVVTLIFLTPLFYFLPHAVLGAVIITAVFGLIDFREITHLWRTDRKDMVMLLATFLGTLFVGIEEGIAIGVILSLALVLYRSTYPHTAVLGKIPGTDIFRNVNRFKEAVEVESVLILRFDAELFFANAQYFRSTIETNLLHRPETRLVIVNAEAVNSLDSSAVHMIRDLYHDLKRDGVTMVFAGVKGPVRDVMQRAHLVSDMGTEHFFDSMEEALESFDGAEIKPQKKRKFQANMIAI